MREESGMEATANFVGTRMYGRCAGTMAPGQNPDTARGKCPSVATEKVEDTVARDHKYGVTLRG
jgi:hypothetical protein